ncbi:MAG: DNA-binding protein [Rhodobacteraceae bacterium]|nr:DNA-binding protein [Paracoccaceae bacterium]MAY45317.1 DNA-binding protein [Paracoccaceae bacterium]QEW23208.1 putative nucleic-acid-binding protein containing a Zn-ribbon [Paracoccaceae bacterium]
MSVIELDRCAACGHRQLTGAVACRACGATSLGRVIAAGVCHVVAVTVVDRSPVESPVGTVPFTIAMVTLDDAPEVRLMGASATGLSIGEAARIRSETGAAPYILSRP